MIKIRKEFFFKEKGPEIFVVWKTNKEALTENLKTQKVLNIWKRK